MGSAGSEPPLRIGRYALFREIASGGMATVHVGRLLGPAGFSRTVAIKRMHPQCAKEPEFVAMFVDEARLAARVQHPNVVPTLDVVADGGELFLVMEYVRGESLARVAAAAEKNGERLPPRVVAAIVCGVLHGLHAAHEAKSEQGAPLGMVHRDVSAQNVLVGVDGVARVLDFGVAKAIGRIHTTRGGEVKGKLAYMAPEQIRGAAVDRRTDVYAAGVVLWEALTGQRLFAGASDAETINRVLSASVRPPSAVVSTLPRAVDAVALRALERDPDLRFPTARDMALALQAATEPAPAPEIGELVERLAAGALAERAALVAAIESASSQTPALDDVLAPPPASRTRPMIALAVLAAGVVGTLAWALAHRTVVPTANAAAPLAPVAPTASETPAPLPSPAPSAAPTAAPPSTARPHVRHERAPAPAPAKPKCDPPWYVDASGIKKWKPECK